MVNLDIRIERVFDAPGGVMIHGVVTREGDDAGAWREVFVPRAAMDAVEADDRVDFFVAALRDSWVASFMPPEIILPEERRYRVTTVER